MAILSSMRFILACLLVAPISGVMSTTYDMNNGKFAKIITKAMKTLHLAPYPTAGDTGKAVKSVEYTEKGRDEAEDSKFLAGLEKLEEQAISAFTSIPQSLSLYVISFSALTLVPFGYFVIHGVNESNFKWYYPLQVAFIFQVVAITTMNFIGATDLLNVLFTILALLAGAYYGYSKPQHANEVLPVWLGVTAAFLIYNLFAGLIYIENQLVVWLIFPMIGYLLSRALPLVIEDKSLKYRVTALILSSYGAISGLSVVMSLIGFGSAFDFYNFFSAPTQFTYTWINMFYTLLFGGFAAGGYYLQQNYILKTVEDFDLRLDE